MGKTFLADIPDNYAHQVFTNAGVASNGANAVIASAAFVAPNNLIVNRAWYMPWANAATKGTATTSATYKRINLLNGGTSGTGTTIIASCNLTASIASRGSKAFATTANNTVSAGYILYFSALTVGGTSDDGTQLQAGVLEIEYELL
jgi:hypothetical protein